MSLYTVASGNQIRSADVDQLIQALTGLQPDQPLTVGALLTVLGSPLAVQPLTSPAFSSNSISGTAGSTTHTYNLVATNPAFGDAPPGTTLTVSNAPTTLSSSNYVVLNWTANSTAGLGATAFKVLRDSQVIATVTAADNQTAFTYNDQGASGSAYTAISGVPTLATRLLGATSSGAPTGGTWATGDVANDRAGNLYECTSGGTPGTWKPMANLTVAGVTTSGVLGSPPTVNTGRFLLQGGDTVVTTNASGDANISYPVSFPTGVLTASIINGDYATNADSVFALNLGTQATSQLNFRCFDHTGAAKASTNIRCVWTAIGW